MRASLPGAESVRLDVSTFNSAPTASGYSRQPVQASIVHLEQVVIGVFDFMQDAALRRPIGESSRLQSGA